MSDGDELLDFNPDYTDAFLELTPVLLPAAELLWQQRLRALHRPSLPSTPRCRSAA